MDKQLQNMKSTNIISIFLQYYSKKKPTKKQYEYINFLKEKLINLSTNSSKILKEKILPRITKNALQFLKKKTQRKTRLY